MADVNRYLVTSISEYVECIKGIQAKEKDHLWFRGHTKASYKLHPGLFREPFIFHDSKEKPYKPKKGSIIQLNHGGYKGFSTNRLLAAFKSNYIKQKNILYHPENDFEWLCLMQHYGVPTRLLDWSTNAFTALYFAINGKHPKSKHKISLEDRIIPDISTEDDFDGAVAFVMNPKQMNAQNIVMSDSTPFKEILDLSKAADLIPSAVFPLQHDESFFHIVACITSKKYDFRILAQQGVFMLFGKNTWHLEYVEDLKPYIHKIFIPKCVLGEMYSDLKNLGFTTKTIYPDKDKNAIIAKNRLNKTVESLLDTEDTYVKKILKVS